MVGHQGELPSEKELVEFLILKSNESVSFSICAYFFSKANRVPEAKVMECSDPLESTWEITVPTPIELED